MTRFKITLTEVSPPADEYEKWDAEIEALPGARVIAAPTKEKALRIVKAKALRLLATLLESEQIEFEQLELSQCCHLPVKDPSGWVHCSVCDKGVPYE